MLLTLFIVCLLLIFWVTKLSASIDELRRINQYNLEVFTKKFEDIEMFFKSDRDEMEQLLDRIHDLEKENRK